MRLTSWMILAITMLPWQVRAQVLAGDTTGLAYTQVHLLLASPYGPPFSADDATLYLGITGSLDLIAVAGNYHVGTSNESWTQVNPMPSGLEFTTDQPGSSTGVRLDSLTPVDASLSWTGYSELLGDGVLLATLTHHSSNPGNAVGVGQWFDSVATATTGFLGLRYPRQADTLFGWIRLTSYVALDSSWLRIHDFAIGTNSANSTRENAASHFVEAYVDMDGSVHLSGGDHGSLVRITIRDILGRVVHTRLAACPSSFSMPGNARGTFLLTVDQGDQSRTFKLSW